MSGVFAADILFSERGAAEVLDPGLFDTEDLQAATNRFCSKIAKLMNKVKMLICEVIEINGTIAETGGMFATVSVLLFAVFIPIPFDFGSMSDGKTKQWLL